MDNGIVGASIARKPMPILPLPLPLPEVTTRVSDGFRPLAARFGFTAELLAEVAIQAFVDNPPLTSPLIHSAGPLGEQDCATCALAARCSSTSARVSSRLMCFDKLAVVTTTLVVVLVAALVSALPAPSRRGRFPCARRLTSPAQGQAPSVPSNPQPDRAGA